LDYRKFLKDWYAQKKKASGLTFREFSNRAGFTSPNFFKLVMDGDRSLTEDSLAKFIVGLGLNKQEARFFRELVFYNQAKTHETKNARYQNLIQSRPFQKLKPIDKNQYEFCSTWYHPVIRELVVSKGFDGTFEWLASRIRPGITPAQARKSVELMETLGLLRKDGNGKWIQSETTLTTGAESDELALLSYHRDVLDVAKEILKDRPPQERDVSALTLGVRRDKIPLLKEKMRQFRREILELAQDEAEPEDVVLLTMQLLPVTDRED
jgi:uncharacterized protein (TIGR02147 family)